MKGVMDEIRGLAAAGKSPQELIALGYRPGSVYKTCRQLRRWDGDPARADLPQADPAKEELETKLRHLEAERQRLEDALLDADAERLEFYGAEFEWETEKEQLLERIKALEAQAVTAGQWRRRVNELEGQIPGHQQAMAELRSAIARWRDRCSREETARRQAETDAAAAWEQSQQLQLDHAKLRAAAAQLWGAYQALSAEAARLRPLEVSWAGHPCKVCKAPLSGAVDRQAAGKLLAEFAHPACLKKPGHGWAAALAAGAAASGLANWGQR